MSSVPSSVKLSEARLSFLSGGKVQKIYAGERVILCERVGCGCEVLVLGVSSICGSLHCCKPGYTGRKLMRDGRL